MQSLALIKGVGGVGGRRVGWRQRGGCGANGWSLGSRGANRRRLRALAASLETRQQLKCPSCWLPPLALQAPRRSSAFGGAAGAALRAPRSRPRLPLSPSASGRTLSPRSGQPCKVALRRP
uniref:Uncharacterized protein n=1 Tax=Rangifer tarandus platyrhynchus TaxID=3082113 RepID=A0ACB0E090_RANTA|nr:unnamed protein product [Rangifer tarandus platyrhynchus]